MIQTPAAAHRIDLVPLAERLRMPLATLTSRR